MAPSVKRRQRRRPRGSLTREQVVQTALAIADQDGIDSLTLPNLARRLECGVMTIYGYVANKEDLLGAISQAGLRDLRLPQPVPRDAAGILLSWGRALRGTLLAHPSLPAIFLAQPVLGQAILRGLEALLGRLAQDGMPPSVGARAVYAVLIYSTGFVAWEIPRTHRQPQSTYAISWRRELAGTPPDTFPLVIGVVDELGRVAGEEQFELGLTALVAGIVARI